MLSQTLEGPTDGNTDPARATGWQGQTRPPCASSEGKMSVTLSLLGPSCEWTDVS